MPRVYECPRNDAHDGHEWNPPWNKRETYLCGGVKQPRERILDTITDAVSNLYECFNDMDINLDAEIARGTITRNEIVAKFATELAAPKTED